MEGYCGVVWMVRVRKRKWPIHGSERMGVSDWLSLQIVSSAAGGAQDGR